MLCYRDSLLASLMDSVRASGNRDVHIKMNFTDRGKRLSPFSYPVDEEVIDCLNVVFPTLILGVLILRFDWYCGYKVLSRISSALTQ